MITTVVVAAATGAASALGGWAFNEITHIHKKLFLLQQRVSALELKK